MHFVVLTMYAYAYAHASSSMVITLAQWLCVCSLSFANEFRQKVCTQFLVFGKERKKSQAE